LNGSGARVSLKISFLGEHVHARPRLMEDHKRFLDRQIALLNAPVDAEVLSTCPADVQAGWKALFAAQTVARKTKLKCAFSGDGLLC
jgi:hypothetical protein